MIRITNSIIMILTIITILCSFSIFDISYTKNEEISKRLLER